MVAFSFTVALIMYFGIVGWGVMCIFPPRIRALQAALIGPAVGAATVLLPVFWLNRLGFPVKDFASVLAPVLGVGSGVALYAWGKAPWKSVRWFALIALMGLALVGWPMFLHGFDWVSYANDDMANYCLGAQRFLDHGYYDLPNTDDYLSGRDYAQSFWFMHAANGIRAGSELMLAAVWGATSLNAHQIFMPVILALHISLICAGAAIAVRRSRMIKAPLIACLFLAISPLTTLGSIYQLIGQVGGLMLLCASVVLLFRGSYSSSIRQLVIRNIPGAITCSALIIWYPESMPFLCLGLFVYVLIYGTYNLVHAKRIAISTVTVGVVSLLFLGSYMLTAILFMLSQTNTGMSGLIAAQTEYFILFPYYLLPSGIPTALGWMPISLEFREPLLSVFIFGGIVAMIWIVYATFLRLKLNDPAASICIIIIALSIVLFAGRHDFGLYKIVMYAQPFFIACIAGQLAERTYFANRAKCTSIILFGIANIFTQETYVYISLGDKLGGFVELPHATRRKINEKFRNIVDNDVGYTDIIISDASNSVLAKFQALYSNGKSLVQPSGMFLAASPVSRNYAYNIRNSVISNYIDQYLVAREKYGQSCVFEYGNRRNNFMSNINVSMTGDNMIAVSNIDQAVFNRKGRFYGQRDAVKAQRRPRNMMVFVDSDFGHPYYSAHRARAAFYQLEQDPMTRQEEFSALGRHQLFMVLGPTERPRMVIDATATVLQQFAGALPEPIVRGQGEAALGFVGRGSGRVVSAPIDPKLINGLAYVELDFGRDGRQFAEHRSGLMLMYGQDIPLDGRRLTVFGKGIYMISEEEYQALDAPAMVAKFPQDLANTALEYSGFYEDGWISERSFFVLTPRDGSRFLTVKGMVPQIGDKNFRTTLTISVDGAEVLKSSLGLGDFEARIPITPDKGRRRIDLAFDNYQKLPNRDERPVGAKIERIGYEGYTSQTPPDFLTEFPRDRRQLDYAGVYEDGWVSERSFFVLAAKPETRALVLKGVVPEIEDSKAPGSVSINVDGAAIHSQQLGVGAFEVRAPATLTPGPHTIEVIFDGHQVLPGGDGREASAKLDYVGYANEDGGVTGAVGSDAAAP